MSTDHSFGHCVHYDPDTLLGLAGKKATGICDAGIRYRDVRIDPPLRRPGSMSVVFPCLRNAEGLGFCAARVYPTPEQIKASEKESDRIFALMIAGKCPTCEAELVRTEHPGGFLSRCPNCPEVSMRGCRGGHGGR